MSQIKITDEERRILSAEDLVDLQRTIDNFEAQAHLPKDPNGMRQDKTDFPIVFIEDDNDEPIDLYPGLERPIR